jgi:hypothetical protein
VIYAIAISQLIARNLAASFVGKFYKLKYNPSPFFSYIYADFDVSHDFIVGIFYISLLPPHLLTCKFPIEDFFSYLLIYKNLFLNPLFKLPPRDYSFLYKNRKTTVFRTALLYQNGRTTTLSK